MSKKYSKTQHGCVRTIYGIFRNGKARVFPSCSSYFDCCCSYRIQFCLFYIIVVRYFPVMTRLTLFENNITRPFWSQYLSFIPFIANEKLLFPYAITKSSQLDILCNINQNIIDRFYCNIFFQSSSSPKRIFPNWFSQHANLARLYMILAKIQNFYGIYLNEAFLHDSLTSRQRFTMIVILLVSFLACRCRVNALAMWFAEIDNVGCLVLAISIVICWSITKNLVLWQRDTWLLCSPTM